MAERLLRTAPPRVAKVPTRRALFLVVAGITSVLCAVVFAAQALTTHKKSANGPDPGRLAAGLAMGGTFAASFGAPALKRQAQARQALARWAKASGFVLTGRDEARGELGGVPLAVRIAYGRGPYASRGASEVVVVVRPGAPDFGWIADSEPFDDVDVVERHMERLAARAVRRALPADEA